MEMQVLNIPVAEILNMLSMLLGVAIVVIAAFSYHKRSSIRMQAAHQKIDELSQRMAEQEKALLKQQHLYDLDKRLNTIRTQHPTPEKTWTNYHSMQQNIDILLNGWIIKWLDNCTGKSYTIGRTRGAILHLSPCISSPNLRRNRAIYLLLRKEHTQLQTAHCS